jgi:hypothetical protein
MDSVRGTSEKNVIISRTKIGNKMQLKSIMLIKSSVSRSIAAMNALYLIAFIPERQTLRFSLPLSIA